MSASSRCQGIRALGAFSSCVFRSKVGSGGSGGTVGSIVGSGSVGTVVGTRSVGTVVGTVMVVIRFTGALFLKVDLLFVLFQE